MAQPATNPKIEELRFKVKTDPKSRLFFPLAEELRKIGQLAEAEQVLRAGLVTHASYLSGWVSLGRVLRELGKEKDAVEALTKGLQLDPGNVVAARLLAESYLALGEKVEAIKKFKLVHALLPADEEVEEIIRRLDQELNSPAGSVAGSVALSEPDDEMVVERSGADRPAPAPPVASVPAAGTGQAGVPVLHTEVPVAPADVPAPPSAADENVFDITYSKLKKDIDVAMSTGDSEPMSADHAANPFGEPAGGYNSDAFDLEQPDGFHIDAAPPTTEMPMPSVPDFDSSFESEDEADVFDDRSGIAPGFIQGSFNANVPPAAPGGDDFSKTIIMADLYANQGLIDEARDIYEDILARDPDNESVRERLDALGEMPVARQEWDEQELPDDEEDRAQSSGLGAQYEDPPEAVALAPEPARPAAARNAKVDKLQSWLSKVKRSEAGDV